MNRFRIFALLLTAVWLAALLASSTQDQKPQDKDADKKPATSTPATKGRKEPKKDEKKEEPKEEKKGGMTADTFSGLKFRLIGTGAASGRVMSIAVNPKNKFEYYVGVASGG